MSREFDVLLVALLSLTLLLVLVLLVRSTGGPKRPHGPNRHRWTRELPSWGGLYRRTLAWRVAHPQSLALRRSPDLLARARDEQRKCLAQGLPRATSGADDT